MHLALHRLSFVVTVRPAPIPRATTRALARSIARFCHASKALLTIYPIETLNGLAKAERQKRIRNAYPLWQGIMADSPVYHPHFALLPRVYAISAQTLSAVYDCVYVCLAEKEGCELVTADDRLVQNLQTRFPFVLHLRDLP